MNQNNLQNATNRGEPNYFTKRYKSRGEPVILQNATNRGMNQNDVI